MASHQTRLNNLYLMRIECPERSRGTFVYNSNMFYVYMAKNSIGRLYIGITKNPENRISYHNQKRGAKFTKYKTDFSIVFLEEYSTLAEARKREIQIKKWRREKKELLIEKYAVGLSTKIYKK